MENETEAQSGIQEKRFEREGRSKAGKKEAKFEDRMGGREECRILSECYREKKKECG
jgi:hypothetical protein